MVSKISDYACCLDGLVRIQAAYRGFQEGRLAFRATLQHCGHRNLPRLDAGVGHLRSPTAASYLEPTSNAHGTCCSRTIPNWRLGSFGSRRFTIYNSAHAKQRKVFRGSTIWKRQNSQVATSVEEQKETGPKASHTRQAADLAHAGLAHGFEIVLVLEVGTVHVKRATPLDRHAQVSRFPEQDALLLRCRIRWL